MESAKRRPPRRRMTRNYEVIETRFRELGESYGLVDYNGTLYGRQGSIYFVKFGRSRAKLIKDWRVVSGADSPYVAHHETAFIESALELLR